jgi:hypothetical protein
MVDIIILIIITIRGRKESLGLGLEKRELLEDFKQERDMVIFVFGKNYSLEMRSD